LVEKFVSIIDDDVDITNLFYEVLRNIQEIKPFKFTDPKIALQHFKDNVSSYKVVISDLKMPEMNGIQLLSALKDLKPSLRTVLITAFEVNDRIFEEYKRNKVIDVMLQKPIKIQELSKQISLLIEELPRQSESTRVPLIKE
jgi:DNA-binding NtrC family response regulator